MYAFRVFIAVALASVAGSVLAQAGAPLPKAMSGHWTVLASNGRVYTGDTSVVLDAPDGTGAVTGRFTSPGVTCGALDEPLSGTWDGSELRFETMVRPNENTQQRDGECGSGKLTYVLKRNPGQPGFEGEGHRDGMQVPVQVTLAP
jgi:hypothetical protein